MFLDNSKQLERHAAWPFRTGLPFLHGRFAGIQITGKDRLADMIVFADFLDFLRLNLGEDSQAGCIETTHACLVNAPNPEQSSCREMDSLKNVTFKFRFCCHGIAPSIACLAASA